MRCRLPVLLATTLVIAACSAGGPGTVVRVAPDVVAIQGGTALVGRDLEPLHDAVIIVEDGVITALGPAEETSIPERARRIAAEGSTLVPGFIDAHVHVGFFPPSEILRGGVTTVRDLAWPPEKIFPLAEASSQATFDGPQIVAAGSMITTPGGYPTRAGWAPPGTGREVATVEEARAAVANMHRRGAVVIKVALNPPAGPTLSEPLLVGIVEAAHELELKVTAHVFGLDELRKAVDAGVDELAHMLMSTEAIPDPLLQQMVRTGVAIVPTLAVREGPDLDLAVENLLRFLAEGGRVIYGTDLGNAGPGPGIDRAEIDGMAQAGMSPLDIVRAATVDAADHIGLDDRGVLAVGKRADIVGLGGDATSDADALTSVELVMRAGKVWRTKER